jgi:hypothetical protein
MAFVHAMQCLPKSDALYRKLGQNAVVWSRRRKAKILRICILFEGGAQPLQSASRDQFDFEALVSLLTFSIIADFLLLTF